MSFASLYRVILASGKTTAVVLFLVASAQVSAWLMTIAELPDMVTELLYPFIDNQLLLMSIIMLIVLVVGMVMDLTQLGVLNLCSVLMPIVYEAGIDPVYFGVMFIINCSIGLITPPVGSVLNVIAGVSKLSFDRAVIGVYPYNNWPLYHACDLFTVPRTYHSSSALDFGIKVFNKKIIYRT